MNEEIKIPEIEILNYLNEVTGSKFREIPRNLSKIKALLKQNFTQEQIIEVIQLKVIQWKNNPRMVGYLRPETLFRESNFENYLNEVEKVKQNPKLYASHFAELNNIKFGNDTSGARAKFSSMFRK